MEIYERESKFLMGVFWLFFSARKTTLCFFYDIFMEHGAFTAFWTLNYVI